MKFKESYIYVGAFTLCLVVLSVTLNNADLSIPLIYAGDGLLNLLWIKSVLEHGWFLHNPSLGAPFWQDMHDFPMSEGLNFLIIKFFGLFTDDASKVINLYYLSTYPMTALTSLIFMRRMKINIPVSILGSIVFAFIPYHYLRGEAHLFLSGYYMVPLITMVIFWVWDGEWGRRRWICSIIILLLVGSTGIYYAFYTCAAILLVGCLVSLNKKNLKNIINPLILISIVVFSGLINLAPNIIYTLDKGANPEAVQRSYIESEIYGLKITNLVLPVNDHRINFLAAVKDHYNSIAPLNNENTTASLGMFGTIGFIVLLSIIFIRTKDETLNKLSILNISTLLLVSIGGFGTVVAMLLTAEIRGYNRFSVFIAFYSILAFCIIINKWRSKYIYLCSLLILLLALFDQISNSFNPQSDYMKSEYKNDKAFIARIEENLPKSSMIFQLPYMKFPENGPIYRMGDYDHAKAYLNSNELRWSYGAMKGREEDIWIRSVSGKNTEEMVKDLAFSGFEGIYIDRNGYEKDAVELIDELKIILNEDPLISENNRLAFFSMVEYNKKLMAQFSQEQWSEHVNKVLYPIIVSWGDGFYDMEKDNQQNWIWGENKGVVHINNPSQNTKEIKIEMTLRTGYDAMSEMKLSGGLINQTLSINLNGTSFQKIVKIPPGEHLILFESDAQRVVAPKDSRILFFNVMNFNLKEINVAEE
ncbi:hypothetical protein [Paenibacillus tengchongensis]|uniref:hypothetical protein n=1 Tax=Paenibacillus tengchongensis TaxID=2608684 RepID=UPI00124BCD34|nr:hypothetical protein [Paenibacillus tengchongensis]